MALSKVFKIPFSARGGRKTPRSTNNGIQQLHAFFKKIQDASGENAHLTIRKIVKRLAMSNMNRQPVKISKIIDEVKDSNKIPLIVAKVLDDERLIVIPKMTVIALNWSRSVEKKIKAFGGSIHTLDQFIKVAGTIDNILLIKVDPSTRKATKYFGPAPGEKGSATYPRQISKGKNKEKRINYKKPITYQVDN